MNEEIKNIELSAEQRNTAALLTGLLGQAMADRYVDVCRLSTGAFELRVSAPIAGHAMREFESTLRTILEAPMDAVIEKTPKEAERISKALKHLEEAGFNERALQKAAKALEPQYNHKDQIRKIVSRLGLDAEGDIAKAWIALGVAVKKAHKRSFAEALIVDNDFRAELLQPFQTVVRGSAIALQKQYISLVRRVDEILAMPEIARAAKIFASEIPGALSLQWHFFKSLQSSAWLPHLMKLNLLGPPLAAFKEDREAEMAMAAWPAGEYLSRMAKSTDTDTRKLVIDALRAVSGSNHLDIRRMGLEILEALPPEEAGPHADLAVNWLIRDINSLHVHRAVMLVVALGRGGQKEAALKIARGLLQVWDHDGDIANLFGQHMYEHHLPQIRKALAETGGEETLDLFLELLEQASAIGGWGDYIHYSTRPFIETPMPTDGVYGALALAVTTTAKEIVAKDAAFTENVVSRIASRPPKMFTRIAMHVLALNPGDASELAEAYLADHSFIDESWCAAEYAELATAWFPSMTPEKQTAILNAVQDIPDEYKELWKARFEEHTKRPPTPADEKKFEGSIFRDRVWGWQTVLPQELQDRLREIDKELGDRDAWKEQLTAPEISPLEANDFASRSFADIAAFLKSWRPGEGAQRQTITALAQALRAAVAATPTKFAESADHLIGAAPIYLRRVFEGLYNAVGEQEKFPWEKILKLIGHALEQLQKQARSQLAADGDDTSWQWACHAAAELLQRGLGRGAGCIDFKHAAEIQALVLKFRSLAPDAPEQEDFEERYAREPFFTVQGTLRGIAVELCVLMVFWLSKDRSSEIGADDRSAIKNLPDLRRLMENELADKSANGRIPRVVFGRYLAWLGYFGEEWVISEIGNLLPPDNEALRDAAWLGHLGYDSQPAPRLMEYLRPCYLKEIDGLGIKSRNQQERFEDRLGEFLVNLHLGGFLPADVLDAFWKKAPERLLRYSMWALGRYMKQTPEQMPNEVRARGRAYWSARLSVAKAASNPDSFRREIGAFDQWCRGTTDTAWLLDQLCEMLTSGFAPTHSFGLVEWLAEMSLTFPDKAVEAMLALVSNPNADSSYLYHQEPVRAILTKGFATRTPETKKRVEEIVSVLSTKGETKYADVLRAA